MKETAVARERNLIPEGLAATAAVELVALAATLGAGSEGGSSVSVCNGFVPIRARPGGVARAPALALPGRVARGMKPAVAIHILEGVSKSEDSPADRVPKTAGTDRALPGLGRNTF